MSADLLDRVSALSAASADRERTTKAGNAQRYPEFAAWLAEVRAFDPGCKLLAVDYLDTGRSWRA